MQNEEQKRIDIDILGRTIYGEARGESEIGKKAVASVIINRFKSGRWFAGDTIAETCQKPMQFSCWNENDPNRETILKAKNEQLEECLNIAKMAIDGVLGDIVCGSCHYHTKQVSPAWAKDKVPIVSIGNHLFYKGIY